MARGMGHKRDLLRKLREPGFNPADLRDPSDLLDKANKLKGFVKQQNSRTDKSNAKKEWMLAAQELQDEREALERELQAALQATHDHACQDMSADTEEALAVWLDIIAENSHTRQELREQIKGIAAVHASLKAYGVEAFESEASTVHQELTDLREHLEQELRMLDAELADLTAGSWQLPGQREWQSSPAKEVVAGSKDPSTMAFLPQTCSKLQGTTTPEMPTSGAYLKGHASRGPETENLHGTMALPVAASESGDGTSRGSLVQAESCSREAGDASAVGADGGYTSESTRDTEGTCDRHTVATGASTGMMSGGRAAESELQILLQSFPLVQSATKARVREVFGALCLQHEKKLEEWQHEVQAMAAGASQQQRKAAQWPEDEHSWFISMRERFWQEMAPRGAYREAVMKKLASLMPKYSLADLLAHDEWHQKHKLMLRKRHGLMEAWQRERAQFLEDSQALMQEATQLAVERAEIAAERLVHELARERVNEELQVLRAAAAEQAQVTAASKAEAEAKAEKERAAAAEAARADQAAKRELVAAYKQKLEQREAELAAAAAARAAAAEQQHAQQAPYHKSRTEVRKLEYKDKQESKKRAMEAAAAEEAARAARLDKLRELVAPNVQADPLRVLLPTEASMGVDDKGGSAFKDVNGYTVDQLYKDQRFKVMAALQSAGLHQTDYARQVISAIPTAKPTRMDNLTATQRGVS